MGKVPRLDFFCVVSQSHMWSHDFQFSTSRLHEWKANVTADLLIVVQNTLLICLNCWPFQMLQLLTFSVIELFLMLTIMVPLWFWTLYHIEVVDHACGMGTLQMGEYVSNVSNGIDTFSVREPLGVCAGICPFNFPAMIPLWVCLTWPFLSCQILCNRRLAPLII
jgi:hypothetical protein